MFELEILADRFGLDTAQIDELKTVVEELLDTAWSEGYDYASYGSVGLCL